MKMDPMFHTYNGVPQESKLATYMKRQTEGPPITNSLNKTLSNLSLSDTLPVTLKKTGASEFIPRSSPALHFSNSTSPLTVTAQLKNSSPTPTVPTYQEYVGGTTYFYAPPEAVSNDEEVVSNAAVTLYPGTPAHAKTAMAHLAPNADTSYYISNQLRLEIQHKNNLTLMQPDPNLCPDLPLEVDNYHELVPLEPLPAVPKAHLIIPYQTSTYKATHIKTGMRYCLRRVHGFRLANSKCMVLVDMWKKLNHSNIVQLREVFTTKAFGDQSMVFVYDYHPDSETLLARHFSSPEAVNGYTDSFSSNPNAPRPYSHSKNSLLRQQHT